MIESTISKVINILVCAIIEFYTVFVFSLNLIKKINMILFICNNNNVILSFSFICQSC